MTEYIEREAVLRRMQKIATEAWKMRIKANVETVWNEAQDVLRFFPAADVRPVEWIPVTERLPDAGERVLCYCRANIYEVMKMRTDGDWVYDTNHIYMRSFVTHWMPLPEPPKEET